MSLITEKDRHKEGEVLSEAETEWVIKTAVGIILNNNYIEGTLRRTTYTDEKINIRILGSMPQIDYLNERNCQWETVFDFYIHRKNFKGEWYNYLAVLATQLGCDREETKKRRHKLQK